MRQWLEVQALLPPKGPGPDLRGAPRGRPPEPQGDEYDHLDEESNAVVDLIHQGRLDEAEAAARDLLARYPEVVDGLERLAMVYDARGEPTKAAHYYRQAAAFILENPEGFDGEIPTDLVVPANALDPQPS